ncbi:WD40 repeat-like protein [Dendrothele bispora CBS 962.96]|uniref:WD40 repeat-like protein n=1 Tax=Dendrothele bispora (strain CBS 962.96) TaxID=1314807 RepID=A0A4S8L338_DENBC|nr:WD40 repeat-like protein [Dendrothele bispora CBS 962.96]
MRYTESDQPSPSNSTSPDVMTGATTDTIAGPSSRGLDSLVHSNGHTPGTSKGYSFSSNGLSNGSSSVANGNGVMQKHGKSSIARVNLPGTLLYEDSNVDREEFVRLVLQSLRDVGYKQAAAALEAESGYSMESSEVGQFKQYILDGLWSKAEASLTRLGLTNEAKLWDARFLINRQKYLELLEAGKTTAALHVLRNEISPLNVESEELHTLSSLIMSTSPDDLRQRTNWDGAAGTSRQQLLADLHHYIPPSVMIPSRRFSTLLQQAHLHQLQRCTFHNIPANATPLSLYADHQCDNSAFPRMNTTVLAGHNDEVWHVEWSRAGDFLASASKDRSAILWRVGSDGTDWEAHQILRDHPYPVGCLSWSLDDSIILTSAENIIKMWNTQTGVCIRTITEHTETVTTLTWLSDGSGFISGGLDRKIIRWSSDGKTHEPWVLSPIRVVDLAISPDRSRLVTVGLDSIDSKPSPPSSRNGRGSGTPGESPNSGNGNGGQTNGSKATSDTRWVIAYDFLTREREFAKSMEGDLTSVKISQDCQYALINHSPDEIYMWDLNIGRLARKFTGQKQGRHIIRSCFGGVDGNFVVSGSEDGKVYVWHRDTGALLETLAGHGEGSVNAVAWNPGNERMFASCSDDRTIRIWEAPPLDGSVTSSLSHGSATAGPSSPSIGSSVDYKGKGKTRQLWDFADESGSATTSTRT